MTLDCRLLRFLFHFVLHLSLLSSSVRSSLASHHTWHLHRIVSVFFLQIGSSWFRYGSPFPPPQTVRQEQGVALRPFLHVLNSSFFISYFIIVTHNRLNLFLAIPLPPTHTRSFFISKSFLLLIILLTHSYTLIRPIPEIVSMLHSTTSLLSGQFFSLQFFSLSFLFLRLLQIYTAFDAYCFCRCRSCTLYIEFFFF